MAQHQIVVRKLLETLKAVMLLNLLNSDSGHRRELIVVKILVEILDHTGDLKDRKGIGDAIADGL
jgi:hypothetical protein